VISVTSESAKGIITKPGTKHICICLTPTRYIWSGYEDYFKNTFLRWLAKPTVSYLRRWDLIASQRPDLYIAISHEVQNRIKKYYNRESTVIFPPLMLESLKTTPYSLPTTPYFLIVSRLVPYKKIDLAVHAFNQTGQPLKIVGRGSEYAYLRSIAKSNIEFFDTISDESLQDFYAGAHALIFPGTEDFGLTMIEAQAFGVPVIAHRSGGALDIVHEGVTGEFFDEQNIRSLIKILQSFDSSRYNRKNCIENSRRFSFEKFEIQLKAFIKSGL
jgi:glycosyltransferase involved in cell wall biosynthesis